VVDLRLKLWAMRNGLLVFCFLFALRLWFKLKIRNNETRISNFNSFDLRFGTQNDKLLHCVCGIWRGRGELFYDE